MQLSTGSGYCISVESSGGAMPSLLNDQTISQYFFFQLEQSANRAVARSFEAPNCEHRRRKILLCGNKLKYSTALRFAKNLCELFW